ncbi:MAG TPA: mechanosensitive ion channel [Bdellovibrionales bacterium]|nr:mechanosensitive ion channel [Bdellovibrionales bacterium]
MDEAQTGVVHLSYFTEMIAELVLVLKSWDVLKQMVSTLVLALAFFVFRWATILTIRRWNAPSGDEKRRWIIQIKNMSLIILAAGLFGIWATELRAFALSLVAVAAALAIATKEILQCFLGGFYKASVRPFELGDRIEVNGVRGEVIDHNFMSTTLLEIGPTRDNTQLSGRQVVLPNSLFLLHSIHNQSLQQEYVLQSLRLVVQPGEDWRELERVLLEAANRECASFLEPARLAMARIGQREGLDLPRVEPRVTFQYDEIGYLHSTLRFPTPLDRVSRTEQAILRAVISGRKVVVPVKVSLQQ